MRPHFLAAFAALSIGLISNLQAAEPLANEPSDGVQVVPMEKTPESNNIRLVVQFPESDELKTREPLHVQLQLDGYALGIDTDIPRKKEIRNEPDIGQTVRVIIDNGAYIALNEAHTPTNVMDDHDEYFESLVEFDYDKPLAPGRHTIRAFPSTSFGESLKEDGCFAARSFYYKKKIDNNSADLNAPYITYNEPSATEYSSKAPVLLDFYVSNCALSEDGYKVKLTINHNITRTLITWVPYFIHGLTKGLHTITLQLMDPDGKQVPGEFNKIQRTIRIK